MEDLKKLLSILHNRLDEIIDKKEKTMGDIEEYKEIQLQCIKICEVIILLEKSVF